MKSPSVIASAALKSARDLETALAALKILQWEKLEPKRSQGPYSEAQTPDTSLHSAHASRSVERGESEKTVKTLSQADTIVMNARRKQAILLDEVVALQAVCRMHAARGRYKYLRESIIILQRKFRCQESLISGLTSTPSKAIKHQILCVQRYLRGYTARKRILQSKLASILIQSTLRGYVARRRYTRFKSSGLLIQCHLRGRRDRQAFSSIKFLVCKVQGHVRGSLVRAKVSRILRGKMNLFQSEIVHLWQVCHVPLSIRTKFWPALLAEATFTKIHVAELELKRLWSFIGATTTKECPGWAGDEIVQVADTMGIDSAVYRRCLELNRSTDYIHFSKTEEASLAAALSYVEAERLQIHERLDSKLSGIMATQIYGQFGISSTGKMKKLALAKALCKLILLPRAANSAVDLSISSSHATFLGTEHRHAEPSRSTMLTLFPELNGSLSISFQPASSKSKRRFPSATNFPVLAFDNESWDNVSLEGLIRKHSKEVTHLFITKVPGIMARLDACQRSGTEHRLGSVQRHRAQKYLFGRLAEIESRAEPNCERHPAFQKIEHDSV
jgi:IQ calmodulin-binding motif